MSRQEDTCWRCGSQWTFDQAPPTTLQVRAGDGAVHGAGGCEARIATAVGDDARAVTQARVDLDRWVNEGGSVPFEAAALLLAAAGRR
jgi:hypothetical protein